MINDRQFVLNTEEYVCENWTAILLSSGYVLSFHNDLKVVCNREKNVVLLGYAWQVDEKEDSPAEIVINITGENLKERLLKEEETWCGRYVLIVENEIFLDTTGSLGVFYSNDIISSSLNILCELKKIRYKKPNIYHSVFPDFIPGAATEYENISRLLPSGVWNYIEQSLSTRKLMPIEYNSCEKEKLAELFIKYFRISILNMCKEFEGKKIWIALTGGRDSRTTLALLENSGIEYKAFTLEHNNISIGDIEIPCELMQKINKEWIYVKRKKSRYNVKRLKEFETHTAGMAVDEDRLFYAYDQYKEIIGEESQVIILRSSVYECVIDYFKGYLREQEEFTAQNLANVFPLLKMNKLYFKTLNNWFKYVDRDSLNSEISIADRFLWELREGCWLSNNEHSYDIMENIISIQPANCRRFLELLFAFDYDERKEKKNQEYIIKKACPDIADVPYEGKQTNKRGANIVKKIASLIGKGTWLLKTYGFKQTMAYFKEKK